ncbi:MAG: glycosyltransferase family 2 protein [Terriglobales bacterium]
MTLSVVIPTWNGRELLRRYLPSVIAEMGGAELVISDDGSSDGSAEWLAFAFPQVRVVASPANRGFAHAVNAGVTAAGGEIVVLLNNDVEVLPGAFASWPAQFADPELFGVTFRALDPATRAFATGGKLGRFRRGFWETWRNYDGAAGPSFSLVGGFCAVRRSQFLQLGGFDPLFSPYYWEDIDLSYRARKRGWHVAYVPSAVVLHEVGATVGRHRTPWRRRVVIHRNRLLFHAKNLDPTELRRHRRWRRFLLAQMALRGDFAYLAGYWAAWRRRREVEAARRREMEQWRLSDRQLAVHAGPSGN